ncbi:hypothetical protein MVEN_02512200 [Mycena venus]|uniref:Uncharacterized protein n=1 Tax=Mycena venus TaxID=2733690 RepID=A0A8H6WT27_9AGAR|nr:hypothetical protein MVEN_02512200 [Mycena venus]
MDCQFSFGPNRSYFCSAGSLYAWSENTLPIGLISLLEDATHPQALSTPYDVAFPMEPGTYALCWKTIRGEDWYEDGCLGPNYTRLSGFIKGVATSGGHTMRTVFGPGASYFSMSHSGCSWQNLPLALEDDILNSINVRRPTCVALGAQRSYVVIYNDRTVTWDLHGQYPLVEATIRNAQEKNGVMYVALNPFIAGEYYAVYGDGSASWNFPTAWTKDVSTISRGIAPVANIVSPVNPGGIAATIPRPATAAPATIPHPAAAPSPTAHKITWQQGLLLGLKATNDIAKIVQVLGN